MLESEVLAKRLLERYKAGEIEVDFGGHYGLPSGAVPYETSEKLGNYLVFFFGFDSMGMGFSLHMMSERTDRDVIEWVLEDPLEAMRGCGALDWSRFPLGCGPNVRCKECGAYVQFLFDGKWIWVEFPCTENHGDSLA